MDLLAWWVKKWWELEEEKKTGTPSWR